MSTLHPLNKALENKTYRPGAPARVEGVYKYEGQFFNPAHKGRDWKTKILEMGTTVRRIPFRDKVVFVYESQVHGYELWTALEPSPKGGLSWTLMRPRDVEAVRIYFQARQAFEAQKWAQHGKQAKEWKRKNSKFL